MMLHILEKSLLCVDLILTSQPNMIVNSGVHSSPHPNCHLQIVFAKITLKIYKPPPYERDVWYYQETNVIFIRPKILDFSFLI